MNTKINGIVEALRKHRKYQEMNREKLAELSGISKNTIASIELGRAVPKISTIEKLCEALNLEIEIKRKNI